MPALKGIAHLAQDGRVRIQGEGRVMMPGRFWLLTLVGWLWAGMALACPVCVDLPTLTLADKVLGGKLAVLARPDPANPFRYKVTEIIRGTESDLNQLPDIPFLVSTTNRRALAAQPGHAMLLAYGPQLDENGLDAGDGWHQTIRITPERRAFLNRLLDEGADWRFALTTEEARFAFFADLLDTPDKVLVDAALAEISRAPYRLIRTAGGAVPAPQLRARLTRIEELPYAPVAILLLGLSAEPEVQDYVRAGFDSAMRHGSTNLDAWAVAGIEVDESAVISQIDSALARPALASDRRADLILALTVAGTARPELRSRIARLLYRESHLGPTEAGAIAPTLYDWQDWSLTDHYRALLKADDLDPATRYMLTVMVDSALSLLDRPEDG